MRPLITLRLTHFMFAETNDINKKIKLLHLSADRKAKLEKKKIFSVCMRVCLKIY